MFVKKELLRDLLSGKVCCASCIHDYSLTLCRGRAECGLGSKGYYDDVKEPNVACGSCGYKMYFMDHEACPVCGSSFTVTIPKVPKGSCRLDPLPELPKDKKYDEGKPMVGQMKRDFPRALLAVADVTRYGIEKYKSPGSWKEVEDAYNRYEDALGRHDLMMCYEPEDEESGRKHAVHRAWNALACLELILMEEADVVQKES